MTQVAYNADEGGLNHTQIVILLCSLAGAAFLACIIGLIWCAVRRRKHRAPLVPYHLHTMSPKSGPGAASGQPGGSRDAEAAQGEDAPEIDTGRRSMRPRPFGQEGRGVGYGFNPVFREAYGGGGGAESGLDGVSVQRPAPGWG